MQLPSLEELELPILSVYVRAKRQGRDRRGDGVVQVDPGTGMPLSNSDLLPRSKSVGGERLAMQIRVEPEYWARCFLGLAHVSPDKWTDEQAVAREELTMRIKKCVRSMSERGYFNERFPSAWDGTPMTLAADGLCVAAAITPSGLTYAEQRCQGTQYESGPVSILFGLTDEIINQAPQYARDEMRRERAL